MSRLKLVLWAVTVAAVLSIIPLSGLPSASPRARLHGRSVQTFGRVAAISSGTFRVTHDARIITISFTPMTRFVPRSAPAAAAGLADGDAVVAEGVVNSNGLVAVRVDFDTSRFALPNRLGIFAGRYAGNTSAGLTITKFGGTRSAFRAGSETTYYEHGRRVSSPTYRVLDHIMVTAREYTDSTWYANFVVINPSKHNH